MMYLKGFGSQMLGAKPSTENQTNQKRKKFKSGWAGTDLTHLNILSLVIASEIFGFSLGQQVCPCGVYKSQAEWKLSWHIFETRHVVCSLTYKSNTTDKKAEYYLIQKLWSSEP